MPDEPTTLEATGDETNPQVTEPTTPETGGEPTTTPASDPAQESSQTVDIEKYNAAVREMNEKQQLAAERERQLESERAEKAQYQRALAEFGARHVEQTDPLAAARAKLAEAHESFDPVAISNATIEFNRAERASEMDKLKQTMAYEQRVQREMPEAAKIMGVNDVQAAQAEMQRIAQNLTPTQLAVLKRYEEGTLGDLLTEQNAAKEERKRAAEFFKSTETAGGGRSVPGSQRTSNVKYMSSADWATLNDAAKQRWKDGPDELVILHEHERRE